MICSAQHRETNLCINQIPGMDSMRCPECPNFHVGDCSCSYCYPMVFFGIPTVSFASLNQKSIDKSLFWGAWNLIFGDFRYPGGLPGAQVVPNVFWRLARARISYFLSVARFVTHRAHFFHTSWIDFSIP